MDFYILVVGAEHCSECVQRYSASTKNFIEKQRFMQSELLWAFDVFSSEYLRETTILDICIMWSWNGFIEESHRGYMQMDWLWH